MAVNQNINRRQALQNSLVAGAALAATASVTQPRASANSEVSKDARTILFQGDSITDAGRDKKRQAANNQGSLGRGYPLFAAASMLADHPTRGLQIHNRGISGNKVPDLQNRWQKDCLDIKPDVLSILIGVNDIWHKLNGRYAGTVGTYDSGFRELLKQTQESLPNTKIVICEPFVLRCGAVKDNWFPEFDHRRGVANKIAADLSLTLVPFQTMFNKAMEDGTKPQYWAGDGVHPTMAGHALMAKTWRDVVGI